MSSSHDGVTRRAFIKAAAAALTLPSPLSGQPAPAHTLYNGIVVPARWPPRRSDLADDPYPPPYLLSPPPIINIDVGRQLFVDDFLIDRSSLRREFHAAEYHSGNPVLAPEREWERQDASAKLTGYEPNFTAMPFSDGMFFDPRDGVFKLWYMAGYQMQTALAVSRDGLKWERPAFGVVRGTNIVSTAKRDSNTVWLDLDSTDAGARFKMAGFLDRQAALRLSVSPDGIHWTDAGTSGHCGDRSTFFRNPFRGKWVFSLRDDAGGMRRFRRYFETDDFRQAAWQANEPLIWVGADSADKPRPEMATVRRQLYNLDAVAYESVMVGLFTIYRGESQLREKPNDLCVAFSRDGFHWSRDARDAFIAVSERQGDWNWGNVQSTGGVCALVGDRLHFYVSGRRGVPGTQLPGTCSTGLATLRRDGFASVTDVWPDRAPRVVDGPPALTTRPIAFAGTNLFVNADVRGELRVEVLDRAARVIEGFSADRCVAFRGNSTAARITWSGGADVSRLAGEPVRFRFVMSNGRLFSFWVSRSARGESLGYLGAGGPGFRSYRDE